MRTIISAKPMTVVAMLALAGVSIAQDKADEQRIAELINELINENYRRGALDELIGLGRKAKESLIEQLRAELRGEVLSPEVDEPITVSATGDLANWNVPETGVGGIGGAMDLAAGRARVLAVTFHTTRDCASKLVKRCTYPLTAVGCVATVVTDLAVIDIDSDGFPLRELAPGVSVDDVRAHTAADLRVAPDVTAMQFT